VDTVRRIAVAILLTLFTVVLWRPGALSHSDPIPWPQPAELLPTSAISSPLPDALLPENVEIDLYGNEVNEAIATYKLDPAGALYEEHSPHTEIPKLGSPKS
jgi:hypothetical protein